MAFHARSILQTKGFHLPTFEQTNGHITIRTGSPSRATSLQIKNLPENVSIPNYRRPIGRTLTPQLLDQTSLWLRTQLAHRGFPCIKIIEFADPVSGRIELKVESLSAYPIRIREVIEPQVQNIAPHVFERYRAFHLDAIYDERKFEITNRRIDADGVSEASQFRALCEHLSADGVPVEHTVLTGAPRILRVGFGVSTDDYLLGRMNWQIARLGAQASTLWFDVRGSFREQSFRSYAVWYVSDTYPRLHLNPTLSVVRETESPYTAVNSSAQVLIASSKDFQTLNWSWKLGPKFTDSRIFEGTGPKQTHFPSLFGALDFTSHNYEYFRFQPRDGWAMGVQAQGLHRDLYSPISAVKTSVSLDFLSALGGQDPKLLIFGFRTRAESSFMSGQQDLNKIPFEFRRYLGGSHDLRGFPRKSLPSNDLGAISSAFASVELRSEKFFVDSMHPFLLFDAGILGREKYRYVMPVFSSAGGGIRWQTFIGVLRATVARGFVWGPQSQTPESVQFHASLGEEF
ncbi:MAG: BamA/TamA family outer membrane protein [Deltaproteobacteria bacterium]|nr:BamA/TamA family outer membrane protein [Deltaproteobacteria bacterium]